MEFSQKCPADSETFRQRHTDSKSVHMRMLHANGSPVQHLDNTCHTTKSRTPTIPRTHAGVQQPEFPDAAAVNASCSNPRSPTHPAAGPIPSTLRCSPEKRESHPYKRLTLTHKLFVAALCVRAKHWEQLKSGPADKRTSNSGISVKWKSTGYT